MGGNRLQVTADRKGNASRLRTKCRVCGESGIPRDRRDRGITLDRKTFNTEGQSTQREG